MLHLVETKDGSTRERLFASRTLMCLVIAIDRFVALVCFPAKKKTEQFLDQIVIHDNVLGDFCC